MQLNLHTSSSVIFFYGLFKLYCDIYCFIGQEIVLFLCYVLFRLDNTVMVLCVPRTTTIHAAHIVASVYPGHGEAGELHSVLCPMCNLCNTISVLIVF